MHLHPSVELSLAETASAAGSIQERARSLLTVLRRAVGFDGAWLAVADPTGGYQSAASVDLDPDTVEFLSGPVTALDIDHAGNNRSGPPLSPSDLPYPAGELPTWGDCLMPAGIHEGLGVALFDPGGRHIGFLAVLFGGRQPPSGVVRDRLARLAPVLAQGVDPMRSIVAAARLVRGATAGVVLRADGTSEALPGLPDDALLQTGSPALSAARRTTDEGHLHSSFVWPLGGRHAPDGHVRVTVLAVPEDVPPGWTALILLSPATGLRGLTSRELEVLGLLVEGRSNQEIARTLVITLRTVATHLEHVLVKLDAPTRTLAAVRAERVGLYVPAPAVRRFIGKYGRVRDDVPAGAR